MGGLAEIWAVTGVVLAVIFLLLFNTVGVLMVALQLPGTWVMLLCTSLFAWWRWGAETLTLGWGSLLLLLGLAIIGEIIETVAGAAGARKAGGTRTGALLSIVGGIAGAILGTVLIPVPVAGTVLGACIGAALATLIGDRVRGRTWEQSRLAARGAAVGKFWGTLGKVAIAIVMWVAVVVALVI